MKNIIRKILKEEIGGSEFNTIINSLIDNTKVNFDKLRMSFIIKAPYENSPYKRQSYGFSISDDYKNSLNRWLNWKQTDKDFKGYIKDYLGFVDIDDNAIGELKTEYINALVSIMEGMLPQYNINDTMSKKLDGITNYMINNSIITEPKWGITGLGDELAEPLRQLIVRPIGASWWVGDKISNVLFSTFQRYFSNNLGLKYDESLYVWNNYVNVINKKLKGD